ncbi:MAG: imidazolonepropionase [Bacteroidia bacterium]|nr:imidazolonepropionase [Bacteroidia bacterium]
MGKTLIGPFRQIVPMTDLSPKGPIPDDRMTLLSEGGIVLEGENIVAVDRWEKLAEREGISRQMISGDWVLLPGLIDAHTHICYAGSRVNDYALRVAGKSYLEIAAAGGGIWTSVTQTRAADFADLRKETQVRLRRLLQEGVTTVEAKSGYGLNVADELKMLEVIAAAGENEKTDIIPTCLAAHIKPKDFLGNESEYLQMILNELLPEIKTRNLSKRVDIFIEKTAFSVAAAQPFLQEVKKRGFDITIHADQFSTGASELGVNLGVRSLDHLEASGEREIAMIGASTCVAVVLPGASLGLGLPYAPARKLLDAGACLAIASDWNPGSAPMGDLLMQAAVMGASEKLSLAETLAGITVRAANALGLRDRGMLKAGQIADCIAFPTRDYRDIFYFQGKMKPGKIWKKGKSIFPDN